MSIGPIAALLLMAAKPLERIVSTHILVCKEEVELVSLLSSLSCSLDESEAIELLDLNHLQLLADLLLCSIEGVGDIVN